MQISDIFLNCVYSDVVSNRTLETHDAFEIGYIKKGQAAVNISGRNYLAGAGTLTIISKYEEHEFRVLSDEYERYYVWLSPNTMDLLVDEVQLLSVFRNRSNEFQHCLYMDAFIPPVESAFQQLTEEYRRQEKFSLELMISAFKSILIYANRIHKENFINANTQLQLQLYHIQHYIEEHYAEDLKMAQIAADNYFNPSYLTKVFKEYTGYTLKQYQLFVRMSRARSMLLYTDLSKESISLRNDHNDHVDECAELLCDYIREIGGTAELAQFDTGYPVVFGKLMSKNPNAKTMAFYSLYDVMPVDEPEWKVEPFSADIVPAEYTGLPKEFGDCIVARGARNQKGPTMGFIRAIESMLAVEGDVPINILFVVEGEEEIGSVHMKEFCLRYYDELKDVCAVWYGNPAIDDQGRQVLYGGGKGLLSFELKCEGGEWGGPMEQSLFAPEAAWIDEPLLRLIKAVGSMKDVEGNVLIDGFYDGYKPFTEEEQVLLDGVKSTFNEAGTMRTNGIAKFKNGKPGIEWLEQYIMGPLLNIDGFVGGYTGPCIQTNLPRSAVAKMHVRLVSEMDPDDIKAKIRRHLDTHGFPEIEMKVIGHYGPSCTPSTDPCVDAAARAGKILGYDSIFWPRYYACVPLFSFNSEPLNLPVISAGVGRMGRLYAANEYITVEGLNLYEKYTVAFLNELAK